jgi:hypothetical protein
MELALIGVVCLLFSGVFFLIGEQERRAKEQRRKAREAARKRERERSKELKSRIRGNNYPPSVGVSPGVQIPQATTGSRSLSGSRRFGQLLRKENSVNLPPETPESDFDSLNWGMARLLRQVSSGDHHLFPYSLMDFGAFSHSWVSSGGSSSPVPAKIYLVLDKRNQTAKVGITSLASVNDRVADHERNGWKLVRQWNVASIQVAASVERAVLSWWRYEIGASTAKLKHEMPQGGWTETVDVQKVNVDLCVSYIDRLISADGNERVLELDLDAMLVGSVIEGRGTIEAIRSWEPKLNSRVGPHLGGFKVLLAGSTETLTIECLNRAYGLPAQNLLPVSLGGEFKFRGRVQKLGSAYRVSNPWIHARHRVIRPSRDFDLC